MKENKIFKSIIGLFIIIVGINGMDSVLLENKETSYKNDIISIDQKYIEEIDILTRDLTDLIDKKFELSDVYYENKFNSLIRDFELIFVEYEELILKIVELKNEYLKIVEENNVPIKYESEHYKLIETLGKIEERYYNNIDGNKLIFDNFKNSQDAINIGKEEALNSLSALLKLELSFTKKYFSGTYGQIDAETLTYIEDGYLDYREMLMVKLQSKDYYLPQYTLYKGEPIEENVSSKVPEQYKSQRGFVTNEKAVKNINNSIGDDNKIMETILYGVDNLNYALQSDYNDISEEYNNILEISKQGLNNVNIIINNINNEELFNIAQKYKSGFEEYKNAYEKSINLLNNYNIEEEANIRYMKENATLLFEEANMSYKQFKESNN